MRYLGNKLFAKNSGQALPLGLALIAFSVFTGIVLFNSAQGVNEKMRLTNAADAASYSGLLWQARAMNFQSYTNRAMIANQVAIAQAVTLDSWIDYASVGSANVNTVLGGLPFVGPVSQAINQAVQTAEPFIDGFALGLLVVSDRVNDMLSVAQEGMHYASFAATPAIVENVSKANDQRFRTDTAFTLSGVARNLHGWDSFTERYSEHDTEAITQRADLIRRSRDEFTQRRDWEFLPFWFYTTPITRHKIFRRGSTDLVYVEPDQNITTQSSAGHWEWKAKDSLSLQNRIWRPFRGTKRIEVPIGWAESYVNTDSSGGTIEPCTTVDADRPWLGQECPRWLGINRLAEKFADLNSDDLGSNYGGIRAFRDLASFPNQNQDPRLELRVEVFVEDDDIATSGNANGIDGLFSQQSDYAKNEIAAVSGAELYFRRPDSEPASNTKEFANTYNPFWDVRLKALSAEDRLLAVLTRLPDLFGSSSTPSNVPQPNLLAIENIDSISTGNTITDNALDLPLYGDIDSNNDALGTSISTFQFTGGLFGLSNPGLADSVLSQSQQADTDIVASYFQGLSLTENSISEELSENISLPIASDLDAIEFVSIYFEDEIEQLVEDVLLSAVQGQINGLTNGLLNDAVALQGHIEEQVDTIEAQLDAASAEVSGLSDQIETEANRLRDQVAIRLENELRELTETIESDLANIAEMDRLLSIVSSEEFSGLAEGSAEIISHFESFPALNELGINVGEELTTAMREDVTSLLNNLADEASALVDSTPDLKAQLLVDILSQESELFTIDLDTARQVLTLIDESEDPVDVLAVITGQEAELEDEYVSSE